jgi:hypothetical protein
MLPTSYIKSAIRSLTYEAELMSKGVEFASQEDVAKCFMRIATDRTINGTHAPFPLSPLLSFQVHYDWTMCIC